MKNILVPTDFSFYAHEALNYAVQLSKWNGARITLVHVYDFLSYHFHDRLRTLIVEHNEKTRNELTAKLEAVKGSIFSTEGIEISTLLYNGAVVQGIYDAAVETQSDLVIMGTLGISGVKDKIMGSKAISFLRKSKVPVLIIPPGYEWIQPENIAIAIKHDIEDPEILKPVFDLAEIFSSQVSLVLFSSDEEEAYDLIIQTRTGRQLYEKLKKQYGSKIRFSHLPAKNFIKTSEEYIRKENIDLFVMIMRHDGWIDYFLGNSMTQKMAARPIRPMLSISGY